MTAHSAGGPAPTKFLTPAPADLVAAIPPARRKRCATPRPPATRRRSSNSPRASPRAAACRAIFTRPSSGSTAPPHRVWFPRNTGSGRSTRRVSASRATPPPRAAWYGKAADAGNARAMHNLAVLIAEGGGAKPDYAEAAGWFRKAAELGVSDSQYNLGDPLCARPGPGPGPRPVVAVVLARGPAGRHRRRQEARRRGGQDGRRRGSPPPPPRSPLSMRRRPRRRPTKSPRRPAAGTRQDRGAAGDEPAARTPAAPTS